jgi:hypothetical protein
MSQPNEQRLDLEVLLRRSSRCRLYGGLLPGLLACLAAVVTPASADDAAAVTAAPVSFAPDYRLATPQSGIAVYHPLEEDGWTIVSGTPVQSVRIDFGALEAGPMVGIWACTVGVIEIAALPYNEFLTVFRGVVVATLDSAAPVVLNPGDSFFVPRGSRIRWDIREDVAKYLVITGSGPVVN